MTFGEADRLRKAGKYTDAAEAFEALAKQHESALDKAAASLNAANCYQLAGDVEKSRNALRDAAQFGGDEPKITRSVRFIAACLCDTEGQPEKGLAMLDELRLDLGDDPDLLTSVNVERGFLLTKCSRHAEALDILRTITPIAELRPLISYHVGVCCSAMNHLHEAEDAFERASSEELPREYQTKLHYHLGLVKYRLGALNEALAHFENCEATSDPEIPRSYVWTMLAQVHKYLGHADVAAAYEQKARPT